MIDPIYALETVGIVGYYYGAIKVCTGYNRVGAAFLDLYLKVMNPFA